MEILHFYWENKTRFQETSTFKTKYCFSMKPAQKWVQAESCDMMQLQKKGKHRKIQKQIKIILIPKKSQKNAMHLSLVRILFRCDVSNILRYVSFVFAKENVECSFFLQWNIFLRSLKLVFLFLIPKQAVVARMHCQTPSGP